MDKTLALHIIAKDENEQLKRIIDRYGKYFDEIAIAYDDIKAIDGIELTEKIGLYKYKWIDDFANKRNFLASKTKSAYYLRMDTDDDILEPENIRPLFEKMVANNIDVVLCNYLYSFDSDGNCNMKHWRETLIRKDANFRWNKEIHENIIAVEGYEYRCVTDASIQIKHNIDMNHIVESGRRNYKILLKEFNKNKENTDPRTIAYLGRMLVSFGEYEKATQFLKLLIKNSGWDDDKYFAWIDMAHCYINLGKVDIAIACCNEAFAINTEFPDSYNTLGKCYIYQQDFKKAIDWLSVGLKKPEPKTQYATDPSSYRVQAPMNMAIALFGEGQFELAYEFFQRAYKVAPNNEYISQQKDLFETSYEREKYIKQLGWLYIYTKEKQPKKVQKLIESIPDELKIDKRIQGLMHKELPAKKWNDKSVVFYCGSSWEDWSAPSVINGVGGSEEAVIYISKEFVKLGYEVTVFNNCGDLSGKFDGVEYRPFYEFNPHDEYNVIVSWRRDMFPKGFKAKKKIIWLHDVPVPGVIKEPYEFDHLLVLSEYHKSLLPDNIPEEKIFVTTNGINLPDFKDSLVERNPHRMIYASSYDRGIENLLKMWPEVKAEVPEAELHLFYGWEVYDKLVEGGKRDPRFKEYMCQLINQEGIFEHGRIGHKELNKEFAKSKFWVYPCHFEEISCITAMKAQAMGCVPVCTDYAALAETVKDGVVVEGKAGGTSTDFAYKQALIKALKEQPSIDVDKDQFGWDKVANNWSESIF